MADLSLKLRQLRRDVRKVLLNEWDPIGVAMLGPSAEDEYDDYVPGVAALVARRAPQEIIFEYLWKIETENMGLPGNRRKTEFIAKPLVQMEKLEA
jgi:hypothetical protein